MKALLVYPEWPDTYWSFKHALPFEGKRSVFPPLGLLTVASMLAENLGTAPGGHQHPPRNRRGFEMGRRGDDQRHAGAKRRHAARSLSRCRERGLRTVVGGPISSCMSDLPLYADHVVVGEAEELVAGLAADLERGTAKPLYQARGTAGTEHHAAAETRPDQPEILQLHGHPIFARLPLQLRVLRHHRDLWPQAAHQIARANGGANSNSCTRASGAARFLSWTTTSSATSAR